MDMSTEKDPFLKQPPTAPTESSPITHFAHDNNIDAGTCGCACDWGQGHGGHLYSDCCECSPCCGDPCTASECLYCCCLYAWCTICFNAKLYASSMDQECGIINHCLPLYCFSCCFAPLLRANLRSRQNVGDHGCSLGDALVPWCICTGLCGYCQQVRSVPKEAWDFVGEPIHCFVDPCTLTRSPPVPTKMVQ